MGNEIDYIEKNPNLRYADKLNENGFVPLPCTGKSPKGEELVRWQHFTMENYENYRHLFSHKKYDNIGVLTGSSVYGLDLDTLDKPVRKHLIKALNPILGESFPYRIGKSPKLLIPLKLTTSTRKLTCSLNKKNKIEILAKGSQFIAYGIHPETEEPYRWFNCENDEWWKDFPTVDLEVLIKTINTVLEELEEEYGDKSFRLIESSSSSNTDDLEVAVHNHEKFSTDTGEELNLDQASYIINKLPPHYWQEDDYWQKIGMAIKFEFGENGFQLFDEFSKKHGEDHYDKRENKHRWDSFKSNPSKEAIRFNTITGYLKDEGIDWTDVWDEVSLSSEDSPKRLPKNEMSFGKPRVKKLHVIDNLISHGISLCGAYAGTGKTTLFATLASYVCGAIKETEDDFGEIGLSIQPEIPKKVIYITEDFEQLDSILSALVLSGKADKSILGNNLSCYTSKRRPVKQLINQLRGFIEDNTYSLSRNGITKEIQPWVIIDTLSSSIKVEDENSNSQFSDVIDELKNNLLGCYVTVIDHTSKIHKKGSSDMMTTRGASSKESDVYQTMFISTEEDGTRYLDIASGKCRFTPKFDCLKINPLRYEIEYLTPFLETRYEEVIYAELEPSSNHDKQQRVKDVKELEKSQRNISLFEEFESGYSLTYFTLKDFRESTKKDAKIAGNMLEDLEFRGYIEKIEVSNENKGEIKERFYPRLHGRTDVIYKIIKV